MHAATLTTSNTDTDDDIAEAKVDANNSTLEMM